MKRIGLFLNNRPNIGGGFQYAQSIIDSLCSFPDEFEVYVFYTIPDWKRVLDKYQLRQVQVAGYSIDTLPILGEKIDEFGCDLIFATNEINLATNMRSPLIMPAHDLMHIYERGKGFNEVDDEYESRQNYYHKIYEYAAGVLTDSNLGREHVLEQYGRFNADNVYVLPFTIPFYIAVEDNDNKKVVQGKYFFYPAQFWRHKNHKNLVLAIDKLKREENLDVHIIFVGSRYNGYDEIINLIETKNLQDNVHILGYVPDEVMRSLYRNARAMIMPSFFGPTNIPPLEAMFMGCPVAVSNVYAMPDQVGDAGLTFNPHDVNEIAEVMKRLWLDDGLCKTLSQRGKERSKLFSIDVFRYRLRDIVNQVIAKNENRYPYLRRIQHFCHNHEQVYIYGDEGILRYLYSYLLYMNIPINGFITVGDATQRENFGIPIYNINEVSIGKGEGIILLITSQNAEIIQQNLAYRRVLQNNAYVLRQEEFQELLAFYEDWRGKMADKALSYYSQMTSHKQSIDAGKMGGGAPPLISVIIPTHNRENLIPRAINSVINQTFKDFEIIVVDDCSTDGTVAILKQFEQQYPAFRFYVQPRDMGAQAARNRGIREARGKWIAFLDDDDEYLNQKLELQLRELEKVDFDLFTVIHCDCICADHTKAKPYVWNLPAISGKNSYSQLLAHAGPMFQGMLVSKEALEKIGYLDENVPSFQEWDTAISLAKYCQFVFIKQPLFVYYLHSGDTISKDVKREFEGYEYVITKNKQDIINSCGMDVWKNHLINLYNISIKGNMLDKAQVLKTEIINIQNGQINHTTPPLPVIRKSPMRALHFDVQITEHCNLNCKCCNHLSPLAEPEYVNLEKLKNDFERLAQLFSFVDYILFLGGEPLLAPIPTIIGALELGRKYFPYTQLILLTNGTLLSKMEEDFWKACRKNRIIIQITKYPIKFNYDAAKQLIESHGVECRFELMGNDKDVFRCIPLDLNGSQDPVDSFYHCVRGNVCTILREGKLFTCTIPCVIRHFNKFFGKNLDVTEDDYIDIYKAKSAEEILKRLTEPIPFCRYCNVRATRESIQWAFSKRQIEEWA